MAEIERQAAYLPISSATIIEVAPFAEAMAAALRGDLPPAPPRPDPSTPAGHTALLAAAGGTLRAVVELHAPQWSHYRWQCDGCDLGPYPEDYPDWPCRTVELIAEQLGVDLREVSGDA